MSFGIVALIIGLCSENDQDLSILRSRSMVFLGTISYGLYVWHQLILQWMAKQPWVDAWSAYPLPALLLVGGGLSLLVAWISWRIIESPFLSIGRSAFKPEPVR